MTKRVLLALPDLLTTDRLAWVLSMSGNQVTTAVDGLQCISRIQDFDPHVIVVDRDLLWGGGAGVREWVRSSGLPISVVMTTPSRYPEVMSDEHSECLTTPFSCTALIDAVRRAAFWEAWDPMSVDA